VAVHAAYTDPNFVLGDCYWGFLLDLEPLTAELSIENSAVQAPSDDALYIGLRKSRIPSQNPTENITDIAARRIRSMVRAKYDRLNEIVSLGSLPPPLEPDSTGQQDWMSSPMNGVDPNSILCGAGEIHHEAEGTWPS
jgi:hypothetical protein